MTDSEIVLGLPRYEISNIERTGGTITISARYTGPISCPRCGGSAFGAATVQRYFLRRLQRRARQDHPPVCPEVLGIDEHFFTRKKGYATTFCDLKNHRIYDVTLGRSEAALESYFLRLEGKEQVRSSAWIWPRSIARSCKSTFPKR